MGKLLLVVLIVGLAFLAGQQSEAVRRRRAVARQHGAFRPVLDAAAELARVNPLEQPLEHGLRARAVEDAMRGYVTTVVQS